eukprot:snap_masked-scaffold_8-processed-gene-14.39-mRNA-1 protein AED:1.00 eAED:1.00 QI:0/0/0/0/1/1/3/0/75
MIFPGEREKSSSVSCCRYIQLGVRDAFFSAPLSEFKIFLEYFYSFFYRLDSFSIRDFHSLLLISNRVSVLSEDVL